MGEARWLYCDRISQTEGGARMTSLSTRRPTRSSVAATTRDRPAASRSIPRSPASCLGKSHAAARMTLTSLSQRPARLNRTGPAHR